MAIIGKDYEIYCEGKDFADIFDTYTPSMEMEEKETTKLGNSGNRTYLPGLKKGTMGFTGCYETAASGSPENILTAIFVAQGEVVVSLSPGAVAQGGLAIMADLNQTSFEVDSVIGDIVGMAVSGTASDGIKHGVWIYKGNVTTGVDTGTSVDNGAATTDGGLFHAHTYQESDSDLATPDNTKFTLQHSTDDAVWADLIAETAINPKIDGITLTVASGTTVNRYLRVLFESVAGKNYGVACFKRF